MTRVILRFLLGGRSSGFSKPTSAALNVRLSPLGCGSRWRRIISS